MHSLMKFQKYMEDMEKEKDKDKNNLRIEEAPVANDKSLLS